MPLPTLAKPTLHTRPGHNKSAKPDFDLEKQGQSDELLDIAQELADIALHDDYFTQRKLYRQANLVLSSLRLIFSILAPNTRSFLWKKLLQ